MGGKTLFIFMQLFYEFFDVKFREAVEIYDRPMVCVDWYYFCFHLLRRLRVWKYSYIIRMAK